MDEILFYKSMIYWLRKALSHAHDCDPIIEDDMVKGYPVKANKSYDEALTNVEVLDKARMLLKNYESENNGQKA